ncbi:hypothetical protein KBX73_15015 [Acetobacter persici]|uniref:hypothetical protein n=1 Tax=Acetobacter persici TaxID=1076596 RepID=UPI001BAC38CC|nr:hypothetical protein [Acetobacter persici]MBS1017253.1 hypothetical protein [Acetobacter persici]MCP9321050.1 hypothetical protein [Acetobacter persici]
MTTKKVTEKKPVAEKKIIVPGFDEFLSKHGGVIEDPPKASVVKDKMAIKRQKMIEAIETQIYLLQKDKIQVERAELQKTNPKASIADPQLPKYLKKEPGPRSRWYTFVGDVAYTYVKIGTSKIEEIRHIKVLKDKLEETYRGLIIEVKNKMYDELIEKYSRKQKEEESTP